MLIPITTHNLKWNYDYGRGKSTVESSEMRHTLINPERVSSIVFAPDDCLAFARVVCGTQSYWVTIAEANRIADHINQSPGPDAGSPTYRLLVDELVAGIQKANAEWTAALAKSEGDNAQA